MQTILIYICPNFYIYIHICIFVFFVAALSTALSIFTVITNWKFHFKGQQKKTKSKSDRELSSPKNDSFHASRADDLNPWSKFSVHCYLIIVSGVECSNGEFLCSRAKQNVLG